MREVLVESYPGATVAVEALAQRNGGWVCEQHPGEAWPHGDCVGPGMLRADVIGVALDEEEA
jgi:hypothetical protein